MEEESITSKIYAVHQKLLHIHRESIERNFYYVMEYKRASKHPST